MADHGLNAEHVTDSGLCAATAGGQAWVLLDTPDGRGLGAAIAYAVRRAVGELHVVVEHVAAAGVLARRALGFRLPISVSVRHERTLTPAVPADLGMHREPAAGHLALIETIRAGGAEPVIEHGVVAGEVDGLEVCRVVDDPAHGAVRLEVGVGAHDREAFGLLHGDLPTVEALCGVVDAVARHRRPGAAPHPLNLLAQERALRHRIVADPALIGASAVRPAEPPLPRPNVKDPAPCVALAAIDGRQTVCVCSTGVDLDLVPFAVDAGTWHGLDHVVLVVPARDALDVQRRIAAQLHHPAELVGI